MAQDIEKIKAENEKLKEIGKGKKLDSKGFIVPENCGTCKFCRAIEMTRICCYKPPIKGGFPHISKYDWCGKYKYDEVLR
jgi:hypothetical protein